MVFRKPYAFFIKYFRVINLILVSLMFFLGYKLNLLHQAVNDVYMGRLTNYTNLDSKYIGLTIYLLLFFISIFIIVIILTLKRKDKPYRDYLFNMIYNVFLLAYFIGMSNLFFSLNETVTEITDLKLYTDISLLIIVPLIYFVVKYILIVIGFDLKKFNFAKDIVDMKKSDEDEEEVELIFDKNTYKVKRGIRRYFRELKYYVMENRLFITFIGLVVLVICVGYVLSMNIFVSNEVSKNKEFNIGGFSFVVNDLYETQYDSNFNLIREDSKYVVVNINVRSLNNLGGIVDFKNIRLIYDEEYAYATNYYNKHFYDLGNPYSGEKLKSGEKNNYVFIFKVPISYKSNKYILKFGDGYGNYKSLKINSIKLDKKRITKNIKANENIIFDNKKYGDSNLTITNYDVMNNYIYNDGVKTNIIRDKDINNILLVVDYKLNIDQKYPISQYFKDDKAFFNSFSSVVYKHNGKEKFVKNIKVIDVVDGKIMLSVPYQVKDASNISFILNFRDISLIFALK